MLSGAGAIHAEGGNHDTVIKIIVQHLFIDFCCFFWLSGLLKLVGTIERRWYDAGLDAQKIGMRPVGQLHLHVEGNAGYLHDGSMCIFCMFILAPGIKKPPRRAAASHLTAKSV